MEQYITLLKETPLLTKEQIVTLETYIQKKYSQASVKKRADILSHAIHNILNENLKEIEEPHRKEIKRTLLKNTLLKGGDCIFLWDVFDSCSKYEKKDDCFLTEFTQWAKRHLSAPISLEEIQRSSNGMGDSLQSPSVPIQSTPIVPILPEVAIVPAATTVPTTAIIPTVATVAMLSSKRIIALSTFFLFVLLAFSLPSFFKLSRGQAVFQNNSAQTSKKDALKGEVAAVKKVISPHLPPEFTAQSFNRDALHDFLLQKNSLLAEEPYFSTIIKSGEEFNLSPLLLFAIVGQEQGFVPKSEKNATKIANNPFNVYHSWKEYNTSIEDSSRIAARTVVNLTINRPKEADFIQWINVQYAEDKNWHKGVSKYFTLLKEKCL